MRPNVDIPWSVHGQIKEYAQEQEQTIEQAYVDVLKKGLTITPTPTQEPLSIKQFDTTRHPFGPYAIKISNEEARDINDISTFLPLLHIPRHPVTFNADSHSNVDSDEMIHGLARLLTEIGDIQKDWFTFHQLGGAWVGAGVENFAHLIETTDSHLSETDFDIYKTGFAVYIAKISSGEYLGITCKINSDGDIKEYTMSFLTDGNPVDGSKYSKLFAQMGLKNPSHGKLMDSPQHSLYLEEAIDVNVVDTITGQQMGEEQVEGIIFENPIQTNDELREQFLDLQDDKHRENPARINPYQRLASYDYAYTLLKNNHFATEDRTYTLRNVEVAQLDPFLNKPTWNISFNVNW